jgi:hypothetical protein
MTKKYLPFIIFACFILLSLFAFGQTDVGGKAGLEDVREEDPGLFMMMMIFLVGIVGAFFLGMIVLMLIAAFAAALIFTGILTTSVLAGLYHRSMMTGVKWFVYLACCAGGAVLGLVGALLVRVISSATHTSLFSPGYALLGGLVAGPILGWLTMKTIYWAYKRWGRSGNVESYR